MLGTSYNSINRVCDFEISRKGIFKKKNSHWSTRMGQLVKCLTFDFGSGQLRAVKSSPTSGSELGMGPV